MGIQTQKTLINDCLCNVIVLQGKIKPIKCKVKEIKAAYIKIIAQ